MNKKNFSTRRLLTSFGYALKGIQYTFRSQSNFKIELIGFLFMIVSSIYFAFSIYEFIVCLILSALVLAFEMINTALESNVDLITKEMNPLAKIAKDCAAGAVLILCMASVIVWGIIVYLHL